MRRIHWLITGFLAFIGSAAGEDLGAIGPTYPIAEPHLLREIETRLREKEHSGELTKLQEQAKKRVVASIQNPPPLPALKPTESAKTFYFDPSIVARRDITDPNGRVLTAAGTRRNPLDVVSMSKRLLFFDATDERQVKRARELIDHHHGKVKPILVAGSYLELMKRWKTPVYFDQQGVLVKKLGITQIPAMVSQEGNRLRIDELVL